MSNPRTVLEVTITKWVDGEGLEKQEIGRLVVTGENTLSCGWADFFYRIDESAHPLVPVPLRGSGRIGSYPYRQSVWALVVVAIQAALTRRPN